MPPIPRGFGTTDSERYLANLSEKTFLDLWSYSNTYTDKKSHSTGDGKELCDLLVVFGNDVLIFSDKEIDWPGGSDLNISWRRWYKRAVQKSVNQVLGAARWIENYPDRIFLDPSCNFHFPFPLPPGSDMKLHLICVAVGAEAAGLSYHGSRTSWSINTSIKGLQHTENAETMQPLVCGDVNPSGKFVHLFDRPGLDVLMMELDTVSDFCRYLTERENFLRNCSGISCSSEADLLAVYLSEEDGQGRHVFPGEAVTAETFLEIQPNLYDALTERPEYKAKVEENKVSYLWDALISKFTETVLDDTYIPHPDHHVSQKIIEEGLRILAAEDRTCRRAHSLSFEGIVDLQKSTGQDRVTRVVLPINNNLEKRTCYVFLLLKYPLKLPRPIPEEQYRRVRSGMLETYAYAALLKFRDKADRIVGIALNGPEGGHPEHGHSEDLLVLEVGEWTDDLINDVREQQKKFDVMDESRLSMSGISVQEYPNSPEPPKASRQQQRYLERQRKKALRRKES